MSLDSAFCNVYHALLAYGSSTTTATMLGTIIGIVILLIILFIFYRIYVDCSTGKGGLLPRLCHWIV